MRKWLKYLTPLFPGRVIIAVLFGALVILALAGCGDLASAQPRRTPTPRVRVTASSSDTPTPRARYVTLPTDTPVSDRFAVATVNDIANLRRGPGTEYEQAGSANPGDPVEIIGRNAAGDWYQLATGVWIAAFLVENAPEELPVVAEATPITPAAVAPPPTVTPVPTATAAAVNLPAGAVAARLVNVVDGDTIDVTINGRQERVRYIGVDTPERSQPGYRAATEANAVLLGTGSLYLVADTSDRDRYDRLLRYVYTEDGAMVNYEMVAQGWAQPVEYPPDTRFAREFRQAASEAAQAGRGFWSGTAVDGAMPYALATGSANIRKGPATAFEINTTVPEGTPLTVFGRTPDGEWLQVSTPDRTGGWIFASLVALAVAANQVDVARDIPALPAVVQAPTPTVASRAGPAVPVVPAAPQSTLDGIALIIIENHSTLEILQIDNRGQQAIDISGWVLYGSRGDDRCVIPGGTVLQPGEGFQVATGDSQPRARGMKCGNKSIWNNDGETIFLEAPGIGRIEIQSRKV